MNNEVKRVLHLSVYAKWYLMQESGEKTEEYRVISPYWKRRLESECKQRTYTHLLLRYGYTTRYFVRRIIEIRKGRGNPKWGAPIDQDVYIIKHE